MRVEKQAAVVYFAPTAKRRFLTRRAAVNAEASALIEARYPREREEVENGRIINRGWHWTEDERLCRLYERLSRFINRRSIGKQDSINANS